MVGALGALLPPPPLGSLSMSAVKASHLGEVEVARVSLCLDVPSSEPGGALASAVLPPLPPDSSTSECEEGGSRDATGPYSWDHFGVVLRRSLSSSRGDQSKRGRSRGVGDHQEGLHIGFLDLMGYRCAHAAIEEVASIACSAITSQMLPVGSLAY